MSSPQEEFIQHSHSSNSQSAGAGNQQDSGRHGPNTFQSAGAHVWLHAHEVDTLSRGSQLASQLATSSTSRPQSQGSSNPQTYTHGHGQSLQYQPHVTHQVIHNQGTYPVVRRYPTPRHHSQASHSQQVLQTPQPAPAPRESQLTWQQLSADSSRWDPNALEPVTANRESILMGFTLRVDKKIYCRVPTSSGLCSYSNGKKERLLHHMRKDHLNFLPFACGGRCRSQTCQLRFASEWSRHEHLKPRMGNCTYCGKEMYSQNVAPHSATCRQRRST